MSTNDETKVGLVGWFDILGYESFLANSELAYAGEVIRDVMAGTQARGAEHIESILADFQSPPERREKLAVVVRETKDSTKWMVFADTIVLVSSVPQSEPRWKASLRMGTFFEQVKNLIAEFFFGGLPLRGAISFGEFYTHDKSPLFAGKQLVEVHKFAEAQQWSGCIVTPSEETILSSRPRNLEEVFVRYTVQHPVSLRWKGCCEIETNSMLCLNWLSGCNWARVDTPLPELVKAQFAMRNKDISRPDVQTKIKNTVAFMTQMKSLQGHS
jgi:hypothetical protein